MDMATDMQPAVAGAQYNIDARYALPAESGVSCDSDGMRADAPRAKRDAWEFFNVDLECQHVRFGAVWIRFAMGFI